MVSDILTNPIVASIGTSLVTGARQQKLVTNSNSVLELALI